MVNERAVFDAALDIADAEQRSAYLDQICGDDTVLRSHFDGLLKSHESADDFLSVPAAGLLGAMAGTFRDYSEGPGSVIGAYKLLEQIGEGGMGVVYLADQQSPVRRRVALKIIKPGMDTRQVIARFEAERQALALMDHPNIARVLDAGATESGRPFFVMELVPGTPITEHCDQNYLPVNERLKLFIAVCHAVQHAHQKGIIHRDIKPSNILVTLHDGLPVPKVIDFGVAKAIDQSLTDKTLFTQSAQLIGTPLYMSPEQAGMTGLDIDTRSDIYALGVLLYELLTGTTPFDRDRLHRATGDEIRRIIREDEPSKPSTRISSLSSDSRAATAARRRVAVDRLSQLVRGDLDWIVMQALEKDRTRRYETVNNFAVDVLRYLDNLPVEACPPSAAYRFRKFARRNRPALMTAAIVAVSLLLTTCISTWQAIRATRARNDAEQAQDRADEARQAEARERTKAEAARRDEALQRGIADARRAEAEQERSAAENARRATERTLTDMYTASGMVAGERKEPAQAVLWFANAARRAGNDREREEANRIRARAWGRHVPMPVLALPFADGPVRSLAFHPRRSCVLAVTSGGHCAICGFEPEQSIPLPGGERPVSCAAWSPNGKWLVVASSNGASSNGASSTSGNSTGAGSTGGTSKGGLEIYSFPEVLLVHRLEHPEIVSAIAFSPDASYLAIAGQKARVWDCRSHQFVTPELPHPKPVTRLTFNTRGDRLATGCTDGFVRLFTVPASTTEVAPEYAPMHNRGPFDRPEDVVQPVFVDDDRGLLTVDSHRPLIWWDTATGQEIRRISVPNQGQTCRVVPSPDRKCFVVCGYGQAQFWDVASAGPVGQSMPQQAHAYDAAFSPNGRTLLTVSHHSARLWQVPTGTPLTAEISHPGDVHIAAFSNDGESFATGQSDGLARVWKVPRGNPHDHQLKVQGGLTSARLGSDGRHVITTGINLDRWPATLKKACVYDIVAGKPAGPEWDVAGPLANAALSPDGQSAVTVTVTAAAQDGSAVLSHGQRGDLQIWNWKTGQPRCDALPMPGQPASVAYSPDGRHVAAICKHGKVLVIDPDQGRIVFRVQHGTGTQISDVSPGVNFTPDSNSFITWGVDNTLCVWQTATGEPRYSPLRHERDCTDASISADGRLIVTASRDKTVRIWDVATGQGSGGPLRHPDLVFKACFSPDATQVLTGGDDGVARLWDWRSGRLVCSPFKHAGGVYGAAFSPDGRWILTASWDKTARLWEWQTGKPISPPLPLAGVGSSAVITPDGSYAIVGGRMSTIFAFHLGDLVEPDELNLDDLVALGEVVSGHEVHEGDLNGLTAEEWLERFKTIAHGLRPQEP